ncbi:MAG: hypothetical protein ABTQ31_10170 [Rhizobiaceae bacterium]
MQLKEQLLLVADRFAEASGIGRKRVSTIVLNGGAKLDAIAAGRDLTTGSFERAMLWFSANWPEGLDWPAGVPRPTLVSEAAE